MTPTDTDRERARELLHQLRGLAGFPTDGDYERVAVALAETRRVALEEAMEALIDQGGFADGKMRQFERHWPGHPRCDAMSHALTEVAKKLRGDLIHRALTALGSRRGWMSKSDLTEEGRRAFGSMSAYLKFKAWLDSLVENAKATQEKPAKEHFDVQPPGDDPQKIG